MADNAVGQGLVARVIAAAKYAVTGSAPNDWFGPATPLPPQAPENVKGRAWDYPVALNLNFMPRGSEPLTFAKLKILASHPIVAMLLQRQKDLVCALDWEIKPRKGKTVGDNDAGIKEITEFLMFPDKEHDWVQWVSAVLDQLLVLDATTIYCASAMGGKPHALQILDGANVKPLIDQNGRRPVLPFPAYQEILKGLPAVDYTTEELIYFPQVYRVDRLYGYSRVEQAHDLIDMAISRLRNQKGYFDFGNVGDGYFTAPTDWQNVDNINALEKKWNSWMQGDPAKRRAAPFLPFGVEWHPTKVDILEDDFDEYLIRLLCFPFGVAPTPFMKQAGLGKGSSESEQETAQEGGIAPLMGFVERLVSHAIAKWFGRADLEFAFTADREFDPKTAAEIDDMRLKNGSMTINDVKDRTGEKPIDGGDVPMLLSGATWVTLDSVLNPPDPPEVVPMIDPAAAPASADNAIPAEGDKTPTGKKAAPVAAPVAKNVKVLAKAANVGKKRLENILRRYLKAKGKAFAELVTSTLGKAAGDSPEDIDWDAIGRLLTDGDFWYWGDLADEVQPVLAGIAAVAGDSAVSALGLFDADTLAKIGADSVAYAEARGAELVGMKKVGDSWIVNPDSKWAITDSTRDMIRKLLVDAMSEGASNDMLAKEILVDAYAFSDARAITVARTETAFADTQGGIMGWRASGVVTGKQFLANPECCEECQAQDGTITDLDDEDNNTPLHPNCECTMIAVLDEEGGDNAEEQSDE